MILTGTVVADPTTVVEAGAVVVEGDRIVAVDEWDALRGRFPGHERRALDLIAPGQVAAHVHTVQSVIRGAADDAPLLEWLRDAVLPMEAALDAEGVRAAVALGALELLESGVTACVDHLTHRHAGAALDELGASGLRCLAGKAIMDDAPDAPPALVEATDDALAETRALIDAYHGSRDGRVRYALTPRFPLGCSTACLDGLRAIRDDEPGVRVHVHAAETRSEVAGTRRARGGRPIAVLDDAGLLDERTVLAHAVWPAPAERERIAASGAAVAHCPTANMKLASGVAPVPAYRERGVPVGVGSDGPPCNNALDPFTELRQAALLHRVDRRDATAVSAAAALEMGTLGGARAAGFERVGALREGWRADVIGLRTDRARATPLRDPVGHLVFGAHGDDVTFSMVDGEVVLDGGAVQTMDATAVRERAAAVAADLPTPD